MEKIKPFVLATALVFLAGCTGAQQSVGTNDVEAPIGTKAIEITVSSSPEDAYQRLGQVLQDHGYGFANSDATLKSITTESRDASGSFGTVLNIQIVGSVRIDNGTYILLRGTFSDGYDIEKTGQRGSHARRAWVALHQIAEAIGPNLRYRTQ